MVGVGGSCKLGREVEDVTSKSPLVRGSHDVMNHTSKIYEASTKQNRGFETVMVGDLGPAKPGTSFHGTSQS